MREVLVSVFCAAYNQELYIRDAIEGFLNQKVKFQYEIIIHDDASTDKTTEIIREYEKKYPDKIRGIYQAENQYRKNDLNGEYLYLYYQMVENCRGKYIANCDGDDYWIDPKKLQIQADYMEAHPECVMTGHNEIFMDCKNFTVSSMNKNGKTGVVKAEEVITEKIWLQPSSRMFRREAMVLDAFSKKFGIADYPMALQFLERGTIYYFDRIMGVYRRYTKGSWSENKVSCKANEFTTALEMINLVNAYNNYTEKKYDVFCICQIQRMVDYAIRLSNGENREEFAEFCKEYERRLNGKLDFVFEKLMRLCREISDVEYMEKAMYDFVRKYPKLYIMGAGKYASIVSRKLKYRGIQFEGFVVSNNQYKPEVYLQKPVWKLRDINTKNSGIIIGINPSIWDEIVDNLQRKKGINYLCPFLLL